MMMPTEYAAAKYSITAACNATGLPPENIVGILFEIISEARAQMCFALADENFELKNKIKQMEEVKPDGDTECNPAETGS